MGKPKSLFDFNRNLIVFGVSIRLQTFRFKSPVI